MKRALIGDPFGPLAHHLRPCAAGAPLHTRRREGGGEWGEGEGAKETKEGGGRGLRRRMGGRGLGLREGRLPRKLSRRKDYASVTGGAWKEEHVPHCKRSMCLPERGACASLKEERVPP